MGEYLSKPNVEKNSSNEHLAHLSYGASTMQGWRSSQEDAHNCIPEFDENTALFAVYDGHGGSEVAQYCAINLPSYISSLESYKSGNIAQALEDGFLGFDAILTTESVITVLKKLSKDTTDMDDEDSVPDENELQQLRQEAEIPTETLKEYYHFKRSAPEKSEENPRSPSSQPNQSSPTETNSSITTDEGEKCQIANGETEGKDSSAAHVIKDDDSEIGKEKNSEDLERVTHKDNDGEKADESSACTGKGKKIKKDNKRVADADQSKPGCSSLGEAGPSQHPEPKRKRKLPVVTHVNSDSEESDVEDETYEGDDNDESESNDDEDEEDDDSSSEESDDDSEEQDGGDDDEWEDMEEIPIQDMALRGGACNSGCTAVVAILRGCELYVANAGDSRCVVSRKGKAIEMSVDHKPEDELEKKRITKAGGKVWQGRINGDLNLSRAIGDHRFKQNKDIEPKDQMISALPDIRTLTIDPEEDEFLILACDGIWNYMSSQEVVDFIRKRLTDDTDDISKICEQLFDHCLAPNTSGDGTGCDNMTAVIVKFHQTLGQHVSASLQRTPQKLHHKVKDHDKPQLEEETESKKAKLDSSSQQSSAADS